MIDLVRRSPDTLRIEDFKVGDTFISPVTGDILLVVLRITDGTLKTTFTRQQYVKTNKKGEIVRDKKGAVVTKISDFYMVEKDYVPDPEEPDIPDKNDKFVWYAVHPEYTDEHLGQETQRRIITGHKKGSYEEFMADIRIIQAQIKDELDEQAVETDRQHTKAAVTAAQEVLKAQSDGSTEKTEKAKKK